jgi:hypothetical protein
MQKYMNFPEYPQPNKNELEAVSKKEKRFSFVLILRNTHFIY